MSQTTSEPFIDATTSESFSIIVAMAAVAAMASASSNDGIHELHSDLEVIGEPHSDLEVDSQRCARRLDRPRRVGWWWLLGGCGGCGRCELSGSTIPMACSAGLTGGHGGGRVRHLPERPHAGPASAGCVGSMEVVRRQLVTSGL